MSTHTHSIDCLSPYIRDSGTGGPTPTFTTQRRFAQRLRGVLGEINAAIRRGVVEKDIFNLRDGTDTLAVDDPGPFETDNNPQRMVLFIQWLREKLNTEFLTVVGPDRNQFIRKAYAAGLRQSNGQLRDLDVAFVPENANEVIGRPIHISALQELFTRTFSNLQSVADDIVTDVRNTLITGFKKGKGPDEIARNLTDRVDSIGKNRATMIARSEVINAHSEASLTRIDEVQEESPEDSILTATHGDWDAANDTRVCRFCHTLDGVRLTTREMRGTLVTVTSPLTRPPSNPDAGSQVGQTFRLKPPAHPNGRCRIGIRVGGEISEPLEERLPGQLAIING